MMLLLAAVLSLTLNVTPHWQTATPWVERYPVRVQVILKDPNLEMFCPKMEWDWGDGSVESQEGDCEPDEIPVETNTFYLEHQYYHPGVSKRFTIVVQFTSGKKVIREETFTEIRAQDTDREEP